MQIQIKYVYCIFTRFVNLAMQNQSSILSFVSISNTNANLQIHSVFVRVVNIRAYPESDYTHPC